MQEERIFFYSILEKGKSSKDICIQINEMIKSKKRIECFEYEGGGIWIRSNLNPHGLRKNIQKNLNIKISDPIS